LSKLALAVIVAMIMRAALVTLYEPDVQAFDKFQDVGIDKLYYPLTDEDLQARLGEADSIRVMKTFFPETEAIGDGLKKAIIENQATVELLLCEPGSEILQKRSESIEREAGFAANKNWNAVRLIEGWCRKVPEPKVKIYFYNHWPGCPAIWYSKKIAARTSTKIIMGFYFWNGASPTWPWISVRPESPLADILNDQYAMLLKAAKRCLNTPDEMKAWLEQNAAFKPAGGAG
jgi:hypothetical protein